MVVNCARVGALLWSGTVRYKRTCASPQSGAGRFPLQLCARYGSVIIRRFGTESSKQASQTANTKRGFSLATFLTTAGFTAALPLLALDWAHRNPDKVVESGLPSMLCDTLLSEAAISKLMQIRSMLGLNPDVYVHKSDQNLKKEINGDANNEEQYYRLAQKAVISHVLENAYFVTLSLSKRANYAECAAKATKALLRAESENLFECEAAIGFSQEIWSTFQSSVPGGASTHDFEYEERRGENGFMPATGGDIFLHIKGNKVSDLFELGKLIVDTLPEGSIEKCDCVHGFQYQNKQKRRLNQGNGVKSSDTYDISGSKINVTNAENEEDRARTALVPTTGGSYMLAQKWRHNLTKFQHLHKNDREKVFGKTEDGLSYLGEVDIEKHPELIQKAIMSGLPKESHVARVIGMNPDCTKIEIVRQSLPYGNIETVKIGTKSKSAWDRLFSKQSNDDHVTAGLYFLAYVKDPCIFNYMLDRMTGECVFNRKHNRYNTYGNNESTADDVMKYSNCLTGQFYYVPSLQQLEAVANLHM